MAEPVYLTASVPGPWCGLWEPTGETTELLYVPDRLVGLVIGARGEAIAGIQSHTKTSINCAKFCEPGKSERCIDITGTTPQAIEEAKNRIRTICEEVKGDLRVPRGRPYKSAAPDMAQPRLLIAFAFIAVSI